MFWFLLVLALGAAALGLGGLAFVPETMWVGWSALFSAIIIGVIGLMFLTWLFRKLISLSIGAAISVAEDRLGKLIAITFAAITVTTIPWFFWDAGTRLLANVFGGNPGYESLANIARANCQPTDQGCVTRAVENLFATLWRFFRSILNELNLTRFPLIDLFWFVAAAIAAACAVAIIRSHVKRQADGRYSLDALRAMIPETVRARIPVSILLLVAFYLALSAMFAIPVLRSSREIVVNPDEVSKRLAITEKTVNERISRLHVGLLKIEFDDPAPATPTPGTGPSTGASTDPAQQAQDGTPTPPATGSAQPTVPTPPSPARTAPADRIQSAKSYAAVYARQSDEFKRVIDGAPTRLSQLTTETIAQATSSPRAFLGQRDRDRYVTAVMDHHWASTARYETGLYSCRQALVEFREQIEQFKVAPPESSLRLRILGIALASVSTDLDRASSEAVRICQATNSPERIAPKLPPDPFEILGPFGATVRWLTATDSRAIATIVGMIGFGLLGATLSRMIRKSEKEEGQLIGVETFFVVAGGVTAALVVFLGSYAVLGEQGSEANSHLIFVTCLVGAVFSEDIWVWARKKFTPKVEEEGVRKDPKPDSKSDATLKSAEGVTVTAPPTDTPPLASETAGEAIASADDSSTAVPHAPASVVKSPPQRTDRAPEGHDWDRYKR